MSPGLVLSDCGGHAGLKTVSLRGLGSPHTAIFIDGIKVGNVQSGQPDLGMFGLENFSGVVLDYAQNSVNFNTARPVFRDGPFAGVFSLSCGSFGTWMPRGRVDYRLSDRTSMSASLAGTFSDGDFPLADGTRRTNNDIRQVRGGLDMFGTIRGGTWMAKAFVNGSDRGTPGSVQWPSTDRQGDMNCFAQGFIKKDLSSSVSMDVAAKLARDNMVYKSEWGDSDYSQNEAQLVCSGKARPAGWLDISASAGVQWDGLRSSLYEASRTDLTAIAGAALKLPRFHADLTLQYEGFFDGGDRKRNVFSPSLDMRFGASDGFDVVGFVRRAFRAPTFNELYYPGFGNPSLSPEDAWLADIGLDWRAAAGRDFFLRAKLDGFYNRLADKIVSAPSADNPAIWLPYNIGKVRSFGLDADFRISYSSGEWKSDFSARYSFQDAGDVPFLSRHTVVLAGDASFRKWRMDAVWNLRAGRNDPSGAMPDWNSLDVILSREFVLGGGESVVLRLNAGNIAGCRYELASGYPMPGRNILGTVEYRF